METIHRRRVTLLLPQNLDQNLEMFATFKGKTKTALITEALCSYLENQGVSDPTRPPSDIWGLQSEEPKTV